MSHKGKKRVEPTAVLTDMLQVTSLAMKFCCTKTAELRLEGIRLETLKFLQERLQDLLQYIKKYMHETVYYHLLFIRPVWNILEEEEWVDIHKWDRESRLQCHILYCSVLHNLSEMKKK